MKLAVASLVLALVQGTAAATSSGEQAAGQCLTAAAAYANATQYANGDDCEKVDWTDQASYYSDVSNVEYNIESNLGALADALGIDFDYDANDQEGQEDQEGEQVQYLSTQGYAVPNDEELAKALGLEDREAFEKFYQVLWDLAQAGGQCANSNVNNDAYDQDADNAEDANDADDADDAEDADDEDMDEDANDEDANDEDDKDDQDDADDGEDGDDGDDGDDKDDKGDRRRRLGVARRRLQEDEEDEAQEDQQQQDDLVTSIVRNCGDVFYAYGVDLSNMDLGDDNQDNADNDQLSEALYDLSLHINLEIALQNVDVENANEDGAADDNVKNVLQYLGLDYDDIDDDDLRDLEVRLAVKSGALYNYLYENAAYGTFIEDWGEFLENFFAYIGIEGDYNLDNIDSYLAADIYNAEFDVEELGCQAAMIAQFGEDEAIDRGYVAGEKSAFQTFLDACAENLSTGAIVGIAVAVLAVVMFLACLTYKCGKSQGSADKKKPLIEDIYHSHSDTSSEA